MLAWLDGARGVDGRAARTARWAGCRALAFLLALTVTALAAPGTARAFELHEGVPVGGGLKVDIYTPNGIKPARFGRRGVPVVIYAHGGGWIKGSRKKVYSQHRWLTRKGYILVSTDYRPVPQTDIDGQVRDVSTSINWVRRNIRQYGGNPRQIVIMGHSAGAHLVAMVAAKNTAGPIAGVIPNDVQAYDMVAYGVVRGGIGHPYDKAFGSNIQDWVRWSPATYAARNRRMPPHLILHSGSQRARRKQLTRGYANLLRSRGTRAETFDGGAYTHGSIARSLGGDNSVTRAVERFLEQVTR